MKLLIITQKVDENDDVLGFFHRWLLEFAKHCEHIIVICLWKGTYSLPENVKVFSLGKENGVSKFRQLLNFYKYVFAFRNQYDSVYVHMNPVYICLAGPLWRWWRKKIGLSYIHKNVDLKLRIAEKFVSVIFSASASSFCLPTKKLRIIGHGIDMTQFICLDRYKEVPPVIVAVGRISPIKNLDIAIDVVTLLKNKGLQFKLKIIGSPATQEDEGYLDGLEKKVKDLGLESHVCFVGSIPNRLISPEYCRATVSINILPTGGIDKAVLESIAAGTPALSSNQGFKEYFGAYENELIVQERDANDLAEKLEYFLTKPLDKNMMDYLGKQVEEKASLKKLVQVILGHLL